MEHLKVGRLSLSFQDVYWDCKHSLILCFFTTCSGQRFSFANVDVLSAHKRSPTFS